VETERLKERLLKSLDTNILARLILRDDERQTLLAESIIHEQLFVASTVLLELGWLLMSRYEMSRADVVLNLNDLMMVPNIVIHDPELVEWAVARFASGADFADMIHIIASRPASCFLTFDPKLAKHAGEASPIPVETLN
jgi:predicted nucleic-acid-binding protein